jgi:hypothetical protein
MFMCVVNLESVNKLDLTWKQSFLIACPKHARKKINYTQWFRNKGRFPNRLHLKNWDKKGWLQEKKHKTKIKGW